MAVNGFIVEHSVHSADREFVDHVCRSGIIEQRLQQVIHGRSAARLTHGLLQ
jgi:hypothetical protein